MNIGEASAVTTLVRHLTDGAQPDDYAAEVVLGRRRPQRPRSQ